MIAEIVHGDCLPVMRGMAEESVDAVVADPPFGISFTYRAGRDKRSTPGDYWDWLAPRHDEMCRVVRPGGLIAVWQPAPFLRYLWDWFGADIHIYAACKSVVRLDKTAINCAFDPLVMRFKPGASPLRPVSPPRNVDFFVANTAAVASNTLRPERAHPGPRALDAVVEIVRNFTLPGGLVLDPFAGSGTTGVACMIEGRHFIGIEKDEQYVGLARHRIADVQPSLEVA